MLVLGLYCSKNINHNQVSLLKSTWDLKGGLVGHITKRYLESSLPISSENKYRGLKTYYIRVNLETKKNGPYFNIHDRMIAHIILRNKSGLILVDTRGRVDIAEVLMDFLEENLNTKIQRIEPSNTMWLDFLRYGKILRATVSTRYGFKDISNDTDDFWNKLEENPLITAQFTFNVEGNDYLLQLNEGFLVVDHKKNINILEHVSRVIEEYLMEGECLVNNIK